MKNVLDSYRERLKNPILGTYTITFILCNWRPILILLNSKNSIEKNIEVIDEKYSFWGAILWPVLLTAVVVLAIPYLMMLLEQAINKALLYRKKLKYDSSIEDYNHKIVIASKEFEIQSQKSGTRTIEMLQTNIESLEIDKQVLIDQLSQQKEIDSAEISKLKDIIKLEKEKNEVKFNEKTFEIPYTVFETYNYLQSSGRLEEFLQNYDYFGSYYSSTELINYYRNLGLMNYRDSRYFFTELGGMLFNFLFELNYSKDLKKKFKSVVERLNKHEISIFRAANIENRDLNLSGFNQQLVAQLKEDGFIEESQFKNRYNLTTNGLNLRNLIGLLPEN
ncbi:hypothetical protein [Flavobacterium hankyongi]|uniref:hypothetical protein n=1 Tax=Flavobacterium hankyongi TaxID=1176532 RepID=UPI0031EA2605